MFDKIGALPIFRIFRVLKLKIDEFNMFYWYVKNTKKNVYFGFAKIRALPISDIFHSVVKLKKWNIHSTWFIDP